jgi:polysaccharide export outer membrane protein
MSAGFIRVLTLWLLTLALVGATAPGANAQSVYKIRPGDTLNIEVLEDEGLNRNVLVLPDGTISFPLVGTVKARGRSVADLQRTLASGLASNFAVAPNVFVSVGSLVEPPDQTTPDPVTIDTYVMGEIANPGKVEVEPGTTILQLLAQAGGLTRFAADKRIELRRTDPKSRVVTTYLFSYSRHVKEPRISGSTVLAKGDVVVVPPRRLFE